MSVMPALSSAKSPAVLTGELAAHADTLRAIAIRICLTAATTRWESPAASMFRKRVRHTAVRLRAAADELDHAAEQIRRYLALQSAANGTGGR